MIPINQFQLRLRTRNLHGNNSISHRHHKFLRNVYKNDNETNVMHHVQLKDEIQKTERLDNIKGRLNETEKCEEVKEDTNLDNNSNNIDSIRNPTIRNNFDSNSSDILGNNATVKDDKISSSNNTEQPIEMMNIINEHINQRGSSSKLFTKEIKLALEKLDILSNETNAETDIVDLRDNQEGSVLEMWEQLNNPFNVTFLDEELDLNEKEPLGLMNKRNDSVKKISLSNPVIETENLLQTDKPNINEISETRNESPEMHISHQPNMNAPVEAISNKTTSDIPQNVPTGKNTRNFSQSNGSTSHQLSSQKTTNLNNVVTENNALIGPQYLVGMNSNKTTTSSNNTQYEELEVNIIPLKSQSSDEMADVESNDQDRISIAMIAAGKNEVTGTSPLKSQSGEEIEEVESNDQDRISSDVLGIENGNVSYRFVFPSNEKGDEFEHFSDYHNDWINSEQVLVDKNGLSRECAKYVEKVNLPFLILQTHPSTN